MCYERGERTTRPNALIHLITLLVVVVGSISILTSLGVIQ